MVSIVPVSLAFVTMPVCQVRCCPYQLLLIQCYECVQEHGRLAPDWSLAKCRHRLEIWGDLGDRAARELQTGQQIQVLGRLRNEECTNAQGSNKAVYKIAVSNIFRIQAASFPFGDQDAQVCFNCT